MQASFDFQTLEFLCQGAASAVGLSASSFGLARPGIAPPLPKWRQAASLDFGAVRFPATPKYSSPL